MNDIISKQLTIDIIHKTIYGFFDVAKDDSEEPINEKDKLLLEVNKAICNRIKELPSTERAGEWVEHLDIHPLAREESKYVCSCCGWRTRQVEVGGHLVGGYGAEAIGAEWVCTKWKDLFYNYCPNCGAKMINKE